MLVSNFSYTLPSHLIAQYPPKQHGDSRLLVVPANSEEFQDSHMDCLPSLLKAPDLLVFNNSKVLPARLYGKKESGAKVEILLERIGDAHHGIAQLRSNKPLARHSRILLDHGAVLVISGYRNGMALLEIESETDLWQILQHQGHMPLPPYIRRKDTPLDTLRYQPIFAKNPGSVAASTAALHFTETLMRHLSDAKIVQAPVTLHIGAGTFKPVREEHAENHHMHSEWCAVSAETCAIIRKTKHAGGRIIAVGTSALRALETAAQSGILQAYTGETDLFIHDNCFPFRVVDGLLTNFHLPESTLLMLTAAFSGRDRILAAYTHAIQQSYQFLSYGDAMLLQRRENHAV